MREGQMKGGVRPGGGWDKGGPGEGWGEGQVEVG